VSPHAQALTALAAAVFAAAALACAPAPARRATPPPPPPAVALERDAGADAAAPAGSEVPSVDELAARGPTDMPLMREALRASDVTSAPVVLAATSADTCFRAVVAASAPVRAWFEDDKRTRRGEPAEEAGLVPPRGPACARKGEHLRLVVEPPSPGVIARAVVWRAP
jgi:hypothetical protein